MTSFVQALGRLDLNAGIFSILRKIFVKISWMLVLGTSLIGVFCDVYIKLCRKNIKRAPIPRKYTLVK